MKYFVILILISSGCSVNNEGGINITSERSSDSPLTPDDSPNSENNDTPPTSQNISNNLTVDDCPPIFIPVPENTSLGVSSFCVMKFEAKSDGAGGIATSSNNVPLGHKTPTEAFSLCSNINVNGFDGTFALISNPEWMTIARDIESNSDNWNGGVIGFGSLFIGHNDNSPGSLLAVTDESDPYNGTSDSSSSSPLQKRTHTLSNGQVIWDLGANIMEWVDWDASDSSFTTGPTNCPDNNPPIEIYAAKSSACYNTTLFDNDFLPGNPANISPEVNYDISYGVGKFRGGSGGAALRGGYYYDGGAYGGIFSLTFVRGTNNTHSAYGFRCVYKP